MTISYRQSNLFISLCQDGCDYNEYTKDSERVSCSCDAQTNSTKTSFSTIEVFSSFIFNSFYSSIKVSNFMVMKCYKLFFDFSDFFKNVGKILMLILYLLFIVLMILCIIKKDKQLLGFMMTIINYKFNVNKPPKTDLPKEKLKLSIKKDNNLKKSMNNLTIKTVKKKTSKESKNSISYKIKHNPPIKKKVGNKKKSKTENHYINANINIISYPKKSKKDKILNESSKISFNRSTLKNLNKSEFDKRKKRSVVNSFASSKNKLKKNSLSIVERQKQLNNYEFNYLNYKQAIILDNRSILKFYWCLLKQKHLILFAILPENDYNLHYMKILMFILSFSLYFTINAFFFVDDTMEKINLYSGNYNFFFNLPQIIYSSIITTVVTILLKNLSLSMKNILSIKTSKDMKSAKDRCRKMKEQLNTKFIIFFIFGNILMLFYFYFIACFCSVYKNTQHILIKDTLISFAISMLYPFGTCLIPTALRYISFADKYKRRECLYNISNFITIII